MTFVIQTRCAFESACSNPEGKHKAEALENVLEKAEERLKTWKITTKLDVRNDIKTKTVLKIL